MYYKWKRKSALENTKCEWYFDRSIIMDQAIHNNRMVIVKTQQIMKAAHLIPVKFPRRHNIHNTIYQDTPVILTLEGRACKSMATENGMYNTNCTIHNGYYSKQITQKLKPA